MTNEIAEVNQLTKKWREQAEKNKESVQKITSILNTVYGNCSQFLKRKSSMCSLKSA